MSKKGQLGLETFLVFALIVFTVALSILAFTYFFRYRVRATIVSDAFQSKSSLVPLTFVTVDYKIGDTEYDDFAVQLARAQAGLIGKDEFKNSVNGVADKVIINEKGWYSFCFKMKFDDADYGWFENSNRLGLDQFALEHCEDKSSYRNFYSVPTVFNGESLIQKLEFTTQMIKSNFQGPGVK